MEETVECASVGVDSDSKSGREAVEDDGTASQNAQVPTSYASSFEEGSQSENSSQSPTTKSSQNGGKPLGPWHKWLLKKEVERREQVKKFKLLQKFITSPKKQACTIGSKKTTEEKERLVNEWIEQKDQAWKEKRRKEALALQEQLAKEQELKEITAKMAKLKFKAWKDKKQREAKTQRIQKVDTKDVDSKERKEMCENAYSSWLESVRVREKRQLAFRQLIVRGSYNAKPAGDRNRKQGRPKKSGATKRSVLCILYCAKNVKR